ncbi:MAG: hypothetical protein HYY14_04675 [Candidatus Omnitrophica bacterium]|nr:hypothetical protein [Candidatus Omnitrophota bacterium]
MDRIDDLIHQVLAQGREEGSKRGPCPTDEEIALLAKGLLPDRERDGRIEHAAHCPDCCARLGAVLAAPYDKMSTGVGPSEALVQKMKGLAEGRQGEPGRALDLGKERNLGMSSVEPLQNRIGSLLRKLGWLCVSLTALLLSFFISRYFVQFIVLSLIFGLKWVFDTATTRQLIMIYEAWKERKESHK